ncbi:hypothetical protein SERLADRAFT_402204 [Serpula lacrymans var. lacrymans S7.9]|uniref:Uncharacterized protein n=1 Tax=Serpula lacrymans var. lacrymans (strain S7.9) TaxID=578457 RepID=F8PBJ6_SERL9|nr:uncharacterized protein SERLADRAFT_402204 [Serpula lacrymans var. lacrymans S7.9]EGO19634.1 hypothetical protein SERLADRAFT_402204 [Serpula lacrymans var. lacrymans S7.9]
MSWQSREVDNGEGPKESKKKVVQKLSRRVLRLPSDATGLQMRSPFNTTLILTEKSP